MVFVAVAAVVFHSRQLMGMRRAHQILQLMENVGHMGSCLFSVAGGTLSLSLSLFQLPKENAASIVQNGIEMWERNGCPLQMRSSPKKQ